MEPYTCLDAPQVMTAADYNRRIPVKREYARSWRILTQLDPQDVVSVPGWVLGMPGWPRQSETVAEVLRRVRAALDRRINARAGIKPPTSREGDIELFRDSRRVRDILTTRIRVYQFETRPARERFSHLLASRDDE